MENRKVCGECCNYDNEWGVCRIEWSPVISTTECTFPDDYNHPCCDSCTYCDSGHCALLGESVDSDSPACDEYKLD